MGNIQPTPRVFPSGIIVTASASASPATGRFGFAPGGGQVIIGSDGPDVRIVQNPNADFSGGTAVVVVNFDAGTFLSTLKFAAANVAYGVGTPEAQVTAVVGSIYQRTNGAAGTSLYVKESGSGNTGWTALGADTPILYISKTDRTARLAGTGYNNGDVVVEGGKAQISQVIVSQPAQGTKATLTLDFNIYDSGAAHSFTLDGSVVSIPASTDVPSWNPSLPAGWTKSFSSPVWTLTYTTDASSGHTYDDTTAVPNMAGSNIVANLTDGTPSADAGKYFSLTDRLGATYGIWLKIDGAGSAPGLFDNETEVDVSTGQTAATVATAIKTAADADSVFHAAFTDTRSTATLLFTTVFHAATANVSAGTSGYSVSTTQAGEQIIGVNKFLCVDATQSNADEGWAQLERELDFSASLNFGTLTALTASTQTISATGVIEGDVIALGLPKKFSTGLVSIIWWGETDAIKVRVLNIDPIGSLAINAVTVNAKVLR